MMPYAKNDQENCEVVEDLPEQFDLSRYRRARNNEYTSHKYQAAPSDRKNTSPPSSSSSNNSAIQQAYYTYEQAPHPPPPPPPPTTAPSHYGYASTYEPNYGIAKLQPQAGGQQTHPQYHPTHYQQMQQSAINSQYTAYPGSVYGTLQPQQAAAYYQHQHQHQHQQPMQDPYMRRDSYRTQNDSNAMPVAQYTAEPMDPKYGSSKQPGEHRRERSRGGDSYRTNNAGEERAAAKPEPVEYTMISKLNISPTKADNTSQSEDDSRYSRQSSVDKRERSAGAEIPKSASKTSSSGKKRGVQFDEKLCEVYEVENPHYGQQVKSEKRAIKNKKKTKQKEEEIIIQTKIEMKTKIQTQTTQNLYQYFEKNLIYNALKIYEDSYYKASIYKVQEHMKSKKYEDKAREQILQMIEKDNQMTIDLINNVKSFYFNKVQPLCAAHRCQPDNLHNIPGMNIALQQLANSINYHEIINSTVNKDDSSGSTLSRLLGHDLRGDRASSANVGPLIVAPMKRKADILPPKHILGAIDSHVKDLTQMPFSTIIDLITRLKEICENDLHFVRSLFKYILTTQLETFRQNEVGQWLMSNFDKGYESANTIFSRLCSFGGIENRCIKGLWKNITLEPGEKSEIKCLWNAVYLSSGWRFIQPAYTPVKYYYRSEIKFEETEFYFLSDPEYLYQEFLPLDKAWLFNDGQLTAKEFEKKPIITPHFRTLNLSINYHASNIIATIDQDTSKEFRLIVKYPHDLADTINFRHKLKYLSTTNQKTLLSDQSGGPYYNEYVLAEMISNEDTIVFKINALPEVGQYTLTIFAEKDDIVTDSSLNPNPVSNEIVKAVASFKISCTKANENFEVPPNHIQEIDVFGMNCIMRKLGLIACDYHKGFIGTDKEGKLNLVFEMRQELDIEVYLHCSDPQIIHKYLDLCMLKRVVSGFLIIIIYPPHASIYGLDIHGAPKGSYNSVIRSQLPPIGKYLIRCKSRTRSIVQFPRGDNKCWGPKQRFYDLSMHTVHNADPYIVNEDGRQIEIEIATLKPVTVWYSFDYDTHGSVSNMENYCFMNYKSSSGSSNRKEKSVSFLLRFPRQGFYHLAIMATDIFPSRPEEIVYNYLFRVHDPSLEVNKFPRVKDPIMWRECSLITPKVYKLNNYDTHFSLLVPKTTLVRIVSEDRVIDNLERREIENSWVGLVSIYRNCQYVFVEVECEGRMHKLLEFEAPDCAGNRRRN